MYLVISSGAVLYHKKQDRDVWRLISIFRAMGSYFWWAARLPLDLFHACLLQSFQVWKTRWITKQYAEGKKTNKVESMSGIILWWSQVESKRFLLRI